MPYVDESYYNEVYKGEPVSEADFPKLLSVSEMLVEEMSMFRLNASSFALMSEAAKDSIRRAVCAQIEHVESNGGVASLNEPDDLQSVGLGKFNYTKISDVSGGFGKESYSPLAMRYLYPTGLLYRGGGVI